MVMWSAFAALTAAALLFVAYPFFKARDASRASIADEGTSDTNVQLYQEHLGELEQQQQRGEITAEELEELRVELQRGLLNESDTGSVATSSGRLATRWPVWCLLVAVPVVAVLVYQQLGASQDIAIIGMLEESSRLRAEQDLRADPLRDEVLQRIEQRLQQHPDNFYYWVLSGRLNAQRQQYDRAVQAYRRADRLSGGDDVTLLVEYLDAAFKTGDKVSKAELKALADRVLALNPNDLAVLGLRGNLAFVEGDYRRAVTAWSKVLQVMPPEHAATKQLASKLASARQQLSAADLAAMDKSRIQLRVAVDANLAGDAEGATLFVIARQTGQEDGPPLAVKRLPVTEWPLEVTLDDSNLMLPGSSFENISEVSVIARISRSGTAQAQTGDLQGTLQAVAVGVGMVDLVIDAKL